MSYNPKTNKWVYDYNKPWDPHGIYCANRRKHQRRINKCMRRMNCDIEQDSLWRGRFKVYCGKTVFQRFEDNSGYELYCELLFVDKKTGKTVADYGTVNDWCFWGGSKLWRRMNDFICEDCRVWSETPGPREDTTDYRNI